MNFTIDNINSVDDLINFYEKIPENKWAAYSFKVYMIGTFDEATACYCALGHLGVRKISDLELIKEKLSKIIPWYDVLPQITKINDGETCPKEYGSHPKERVLNYLKELKNK